MGKPEQEKLRAIIEAIESGKVPPRSVYHKKLDLDLSAHVRGFAGSMNQGRLALACLTAADPEKAALHWSRLLTKEHEAVDWVGGDGRTRVAAHCGYEQCSGIYWSWNVLAEAAALRILRDRGADFEVLDKLSRSVRQHVGLAALCGHMDTIVRNAKGKVIWRGPTSLGPGARSNGQHAADARGINYVLSAALGVSPQVRQGRSAEREYRLARLLAERPEGFALRGRDKEFTKSIMRPGEGCYFREALEHVVESLLGGVKVLAPMEFRFYRNVTIAFMKWNPNGNTSPLYFSAIPRKPTIESTEIEYGWPYPPGKVPRGGTPSGRYIGAGEVVEDAGRLIAWNLKTHELDRKLEKGIKAERLSVTLELPAEPPIAVLRADRHKDPALEWGPG